VDDIRCIISSSRKMAQAFANWYSPSMNKHTPQQRLTSYDSDFFLWSAHQAALLRRGKPTLLDIENLAEEIECLGKSDSRALMSQVQRLLIHLLKWQIQASRRPASWEKSIRSARRAISRIMEDSPSLKDAMSARLEKEYEMARRDAARETGLPESAFPAKCPYSQAHVLDEDFLPQS
jgi:hypothetical protein